MDKLHTFVCVALISFTFPTLNFGQTTIFIENFDSYTAGQQVACQNPTFWRTWDNLPCDSVQDAYVSATYSFSSPNSAKIVQSTDLVKDLGTPYYYAGKYKIKFWIYIPVSKAGYFNTLAFFSPNGVSNWAVEVYFDAGGSGRLYGGTSTAVPFTWPEATWFPVENIVDLDANQGQVIINGNLIHTWQWSLGGLKFLDANDFFGASANDEMYFDDYSLEDITGVSIVDDITTPLEFTLDQNYPNPFNPTTNISFSIAVPSFVKLAVYNLLGEEVQVLKNEYLDAGSFNVNFDATSLPSGMYLYKIETPQFTSVRKMMLMK